MSIWHLESLGFAKPHKNLDKFPFERLFYSKFTRVIDYFIMAKNCMGVYSHEEPLPEIKQDDSDPYAGYDFHDEETLKYYIFHDTKSDTQFKFLISFSS